MKQRLRFLAVLAGNLSILTVTALWRDGAPAIFAILPALHFVLFWLNLRVSKGWWQLILLNVVHVAATYCIHQQWSWLYFRYICDDLEGRMVAALGLLVGLGTTVILFIGTAIAYAVRQRRAEIARSEDFYPPVGGSE